MYKKRNSKRALQLLSCSGVIAFDDDKMPSETDDTSLWPPDTRRFHSRPRHQREVNSDHNDARV